MTQEPHRESVPVLHVEGLVTCLRLNGNAVRVVDDVTLDVFAGQTSCIVGESGSGKTMTGLSILRLLPNVAEIQAGRVELNGVDLLRLSPAEMERVRGSGATMVFQNPKMALDPFFRVGAQLIETAKLRNDWSNNQAEAEVRRYLREVHVRNVDRTMLSYPHELSGGECQRAMIAMALLCCPQLLIADEVTSALDSVVQAEILALLADAKRKTGMAVLFVTHDFGVVSSTADFVVVMYAGQVVEQGPASEVLAAPKHPYTVGLINSVPRMDHRVDRLQQIEGTAPELIAARTNCGFAPRCPSCMPICEETAPSLVALSPGRHVRCHLYESSEEHPLAEVSHG